jgi:hypothetical protein
VSCYQIFFCDRVYEAADKWLYETQFDLDEENCILTVYLTIKDIDSSPFSHSLACIYIKYGYDECEEGVYKRSVGYRIQCYECEHSVTCYLRFHDIYHKIFTYMFGQVQCNENIMNIEHFSVTYLVKYCEQMYSVLISPHLVFKLLIYFQRLKRAMLNMDMLCHCPHFNICQCGLTKQRLGWEND